MKKITLLTALLCFLFACEKQDLKNDDVNDVKQVDNATSAVESSEKSIVLGKKRNNPYTVENMKTAYGNLAKNNKNIEAINIVSNYQYVRFLPKTTEEYDAVEMIDEIDLYDFPLDYEIAQSGSFYKDPSTKDNKFTWLYAAGSCGTWTPKKS